MSAFIGSQAFLDCYKWQSAAFLIGVFGVGNWDSDNMGECSEGVDNEASPKQKQSQHSKGTVTWNDMFE